MDITDFAEGRQWAITESAYTALAERIASYNPTADELKAYAGLADDGEEDYEVINGVAIIPISGPISRSASFWSWLFGGTSVQQLNELISLALNDYKVKAILFNVNSPGGTVSGIDALAQTIYGMRQDKPCVAFTDSSMCSAAYWLGCMADVVVTDKTATIGSIGVMYQHADLSKADEMCGIKRTYMAAGKYKLLGNDAEPLSMEAKQMYQGVLDHTYAVFVDAVAQGREVSVEDVLARMAEGKIFVGQQAVDAGLADAIGTIDDALALAISMADDRMDEKMQQKYQYAPTKGGKTAMTRTELLAKLGIKKADAVVTGEMLAAGFPEVIGQIVDEAHAAGVASVDLEAARKAGVAGEQSRIMSLVTAFFGEAAAKFATLATSGITPDQVKALGLTAAIGETDAEKAKKEELLKALQNSGAGNPGADGNAATPKGFMTLVDAYQKQEACSRSAAIKAIANAYPKEHQAWIEEVNKKTKK
jgi:signal peptide peptidase SppA